MLRVDWEFPCWELVLLEGFKVTQMYLPTLYT